MIHLKYHNHLMYNELGYTSTLKVKLFLRCHFQQDNPRRMLRIQLPIDYMNNPNIQQAKVNPTVQNHTKSKQVPWIIL
jgi:hypothetical protein